MHRRLARTAATLTFIAAGAVALSACYEVENGPAFSGGDEIPGFDTTLYTVGRISPSEGGRVLPVDPDDMETWHIRRALNGSYFLSQDGVDDDDMVVRPRRIRTGEYVVEYSTAADENWLGVLAIEGQGDGRRYNFCIHLNWDDDEIIARAPAHNVRASDESYAGVRLGAENPDRLFDFMAALWDDSSLNEWECTIMGPTPPEGMASGGDASKTPGK
jgi:hypothetical protein